MYNAQKTADNIKKLTIDRNVTIKKMLEDCELSVNTISNIRRKHNSNIDTFVIIANYLNVTLNELIICDNTQNNQD